MRLLTLQIEPRGINGWGSPILRFGETFTSLYAKNGSGKTPIIQSIAYCLGYPITFREDINNKCEAAVLTVETEGKTLAFRRIIQKAFQVSVTSDGGVRDFYDEKGFAEAIFQEFGMPLPKLVGTNKQATQPYLATVLPIFYLDQDLGYSEFYRAPAGSFITDQFVEMIRFCFGLAPKHSYLQKADLLKAKENLDKLDRRIVSQQKVVADLAKDIDDSPQAIASLNNRIDNLSQRLAELHDSFTIESTANTTLEHVLSERDQEVMASRRTVNELRQRVSGITSIRAEIEMETATLGLNEESRRIFASFEEICQNNNCGLFLGSSESYAKNLLYLKDQIKDLDRNATHAALLLEDAEIRLSQQMADFTALSKKLQDNATQAGVDQLLNATQLLTRELFVAEQQRESIKILKAEKEKYISLSNDREHEQNRIANLTKTGESDLAFNQFRSRLRELTISWLDCLDTKNVSRNIEIDLDLRFKFGGEQLTAIKGSTRLRVILAVHAAIFELYLQNATREFRFLILDTPKQHEIHMSDLARYLDALTGLCEQHAGQIVLSSTEYRHAITEPNREWIPSFEGGEQPMYLGPIHPRTSGLAST